MLGSTSEMLIFPIMEIVNREVQKALNSSSLKDIIQTVNNSAGSGSISDPDSGDSGDIIYDRNILNALESNDYEVTFEHNDPSNPKLLTAVILMYGDFLKQKVNLIRNGKKLNAVKIVIMKIEPISEITPNPYAMSAKDFAEYVRNKRAWKHYMLIQADTTKTDAVRADAKTQMGYLEVRNTELRNIYMIDPLNDLPYEELLKYLQNPLAMTKGDFVLYMRNKRISLKEHSSVTDAMVTQATADNQKLRTKYYIDEDVYTYAELKPYLPNPIGLYDEDFVIYMDNKKKYIELDTVTIPNIQSQISATTDPVALANLQKELDAAKAQEQQLSNANQAIRDANFCIITGATTGWDDTYEVLLPYIPKDSTVYDEKVLFNILISLDYDSNGKLEKVTSTTGVS